MFFLSSLFYYTICKPFLFQHTNGIFLYISHLRLCEPVIYFVKRFFCGDGGIKTDMYDIGIFLLKEVSRDESNERSFTYYQCSHVQTF